MRNFFLTNNNKIFFRLLSSCGLALLLMGLGWGSLAVVKAAPDVSLSNDQIGIQACPTNLAIDFTPTNPQPGQTVEFDANFSDSGGTGQITFTWNFGDGSAEVMGQLNVPHNYNLNGVYTVTLTAFGDTCASPPPSATQVITVGIGTPAATLYLPVLFKNYAPFIFPTGGQSLSTGADRPFPRR